MDRESSRALFVLLRVARALAVYASFLVIHLVAAFCFRSTQFRDLADETLVSNVVRTVMIPLIFFSVARVFSEEDHATNAALGSPRERSLPYRVARLLTHAGVLLEFLPILLFVTFLPADIGFFAPLALFRSSGTTPVLSELFVKLIAVPSITLLYLTARLSAWQKHEDERGARGEITSENVNTGDMILTTVGKPLFGGTPRHGGTWGYGNGASDGYERKGHKEGTPLQLLWRVPLLLGIYTVGGFALTYFAPTLVSFWNIILMLGSLKWYLPLILIGAAALAVFLYYALRAIRIRARFFKRLRLACREYGFTYTKPIRPYRSLFRLGDEVSFTLCANGKTYDCKLFASVRRHCPLYFHENGILRCSHSLRFRRVEFLRWTTEHCFAFESENEKVCIVAPVPHVIHAGDTTWNRPIDTGFAVGGYRIFSSTGFIGALTRDCIERDQ